MEENISFLNIVTKCKRIYIVKKSHAPYYTTLSLGKGSIISLSLHKKQNSDKMQLFYVFMCRI